MKSRRTPARRNAPKDDGVEIMADWKDVDGLLRQLRQALRSFGVEMRPMPEAKGIDTYGFVLRPMNQKRHSGR